MERKLFTVLFLLTPIISIIILTTFKISKGNKDFFTAFESSLPTIFFYYISLSFFWTIQLRKNN